MSSYLTEFAPEKLKTRVDNNQLGVDGSQEYVRTKDNDQADDGVHNSSSGFRKSSWILG